jgi:SOS response regulatory protein OraA/RecX
VCVGSVERDIPEKYTAVEELQNCWDYEAVELAHSKYSARAHSYYITKRKKKKEKMILSNLLRRGYNTGAAS